MKTDVDGTWANSDHEVVPVEKIKRGDRDGWAVVWKTVNMPGGEWIIRAERVQEIVEITLEDGSMGVEYKSVATFGGPGAYIMSWNGAKAGVRDRLEDWANDLKAYAERG